MPDDPGVIPVGYVRDGIFQEALVETGPSPKAPPYRPGADYFPTAVPVVCTRCRTVGTLEFPRGFDPKVGDAIMAGRIVKAVCFTCKGIVEMLPLTPGRMKILDSFSKVHRDLVIERNGATVMESDVFEKMRSQLPADGPAIVLP